MEALLRNLHEWQTLLASLLALIAALAAIWPVRAQLKQMRVQSAIAARQVLADGLRIWKFEKASHKLAANKLVTVLYRLILGPVELDQVPDSHWAHETESKVNDVIGLLESHQTQMKDPTSIDAARKRVVVALRDFATTLNGIHVTDSFDLDFEGVSQERQEQLASEVPERQAEVVPKLERIDQCWKEVASLYDCELDEIRRKVREGDEAVASHNFRLR